MGKVKEREREGHSVSHRAGHLSHYGEGTRHCKPFTCKERWGLKLWFWLRKQKAESKAMEAQMEEYFCPLGKDFGGVSLSLSRVEAAPWLMHSNSIF